tara:strand:- start:1630 stop:1848 length:219 start_codon:yes stop_codon:yes gene_type:complete
MKNIVFAVNITAVLEDNTEVTNVKGFIVNNKRVYKLEDNTILTGPKKIKIIKFARFVVPPEILPFIMSKENY